jgi:AraC family transcriptional activator of pobA
MARELEVDRLRGGGPPIQVVVLRDATFGEDAKGARDPHRHDYHELLWTRTGTGRHLIDGRPFDVEPGTLTSSGAARCTPWSAPAT